MPKPKRKSAIKSSSSSSPSTHASTDIPAPFTKAPSSLTPFLSNLPPTHIYITSLDAHPCAFKRRLFAVPLLLNIFLSVLVVYRIYTALPTYFNILISVLGHDSPRKVDVHNAPAFTLLSVGFERTMMFLGDFVLIRFIGMWPLDFFLGNAVWTGAKEGEGETKAEASPIAWRRTVGFKDVEVVVRRSRKWDREVFEKVKVGGEGTENAMEELVGQGVEGKLWQERVVPAVEKRWVNEKTGYQMLDKSWDLYFSEMIEAHALVDEGTNELEDFRTTVLMFTKRWGWLAWEVWKEHDEGMETQNSRYLQGVKDGLTALGKENLFFRVIEVLQSESDQSGDFTSDRRQKAIDKIRNEFDDQKIDFDEFWQNVGGVESMPGLQVNT